MGRIKFDKLLSRSTSASTSSLSLQQWLCPCSH